MMLAKLQLEKFCPDFASNARRNPSLTRELRSEQAVYAAGFKDGVDKTTAEMQRTDASFSESIAETLIGICANNAAARARVTGSFQSLLQALLDAIAPGLAVQALKTQISRVLAEVAQESLNQPIVIKVAPGNLESLRAALAGRQLDLQLHANPKLELHEAVLDWNQGQTVIDLNAAIARCRDLVLNHFPDNQEELFNG